MRHAGALRGCQTVYTYIELPDARYEQIPRMETTRQDTSRQRLTTGAVRCCARNSVCVCVCAGV